MTFGVNGDYSLSSLGQYFNNIQNSLPAGSYTGFGSGATSSGTRQLIFTAGNGQNAIGSNQQAGLVGLISPSGQATIGPYAGSTIIDHLTNSLNSILSPSLPSTTGTNLPGSTAGPNTQTVPSGQATTTTNSLTDSFNKGLSQVEGFFKNHPEALLGIGLVGALLLFGAIRK